MKDERELNKAMQNQIDMDDLLEARKMPTYHINLERRLFLKRQAEEVMRQRNVRMDDKELAEVNRAQTNEAGKKEVHRVVDGSAKETD